MSDAALQALFAPYCGGVNRESDLADALTLFLGGHLHGCRPIQGTDGHPFVLSWSGPPAPLESLRCQLRFPGHPEGDRDFELSTHQLVAWLMDRTRLTVDKADLPDAFWHWLLLEQVSTRGHA